VVGAREGSSPNLSVLVYRFEHMFGAQLPLGFPGDEADYVSAWSDPDFEERVFLLTVDDLNTGWVEDSRHRLPDLESVAPGPFLFAILEGIDRSRLNGFDMVEVLKARERLVAHCQAAAQEDMVEISDAAPGDAASDPERLAEAFEHAADEIRAALTLTRRAAETRLDYAADLVGRLPQVGELLERGSIDWAKARVFVDGTAHLNITAARSVVAELKDRASNLTTGQLRARIRKLVVEADPDESVKRHEQRLEERRFWVEPTTDGTANIYLLDIPLVDAQLIRNRIHRHLISIPKSQRHGRTTSQLQADIAIDLLKGHDRGKGYVDLRIPLSTLAGLDERAGWVDGIEPVAADIARQVADLSHDAEWRYTVTDDDGTVIHIGTTRRRPSKPLSRLIESLQPVCAGPGCRIPASQCDFDHLRPWNQLGPTNDRNGGPKCRHDHKLKQHGWTHHRLDRHDIWTSPLGHTYTYPINDDHPP
jgi:hypothetical protein